MKFRSTILSLVAVPALVFSCAAGTPPPPPNDIEVPFDYRPDPGESIWQLCNGVASEGAPIRVYSIRNRDFEKFLPWGQCVWVRDIASIRVGIRLRQSFTIRYSTPGNLNGIYTSCRPGTRASNPSNRWLEIEYQTRRYGSCRN